MEDIFCPYCGADQELSIESLDERYEEHTIGCDICEESFSLVTWPRHSTHGLRSNNGTS